MHTLNYKFLKPTPISIITLLILLALMYVLHIPVFFTDMLFIVFGGWAWSAAPTSPYPYELLLLVAGKTIWLIIAFVSYIIGAHLSSIWYSIEKDKTL